MSKPAPAHTVVATRKGYELRKCPRGGLTLWWVIPEGECECGGVMDADNLDIAIDAWEEEKAAICAGL